jgi:stage II sporulation protein D
MNARFSFPLEEFRVLVGRTLGWNRVLSNSFQATQQGNNLVIEGKGIGHRVGFCQNGAFKMSKQNRTYQEILQHYFPNSEIRSAN